MFGNGSGSDGIGGVYSYRVGQLFLGLLADKEGPGQVSCFKPSGEAVSSAQFLFRRSVDS